MPTAAHFGISPAPRRLAVERPTPRADDRGVHDLANETPHTDFGGIPPDNPSQGLEVEVEVDPDIGRVPLTVRFNAVAPSEVEGAACEWIFDDGSPPTHGLTVTHVYTQPGAYTARLVVTLPTGQRTVKDAPVQVDETEEPADAE